MQIQEHVALAPYTTFGIGGPARWFAQIRNEQEVPLAIRWARERQVPWYVLGGGSNLLIPDAGFDGLVVYMDNRGISADNGEAPAFDVAAGEPWDAFVQDAVLRHCLGIECLAGIPGSTGGTPVQNVGAYGQDVAQTIRHVRAFDTRAMDFCTLTHAECGFAYRSSIFNTTERGRFVITGVRFVLGSAPESEPNLKYGELAARFANAPQPPTAVEVAEAVRDIRRGKGMLIVEGDPDCHSAGSFFKNPVVSDEQAQRVAAAAGRTLDQVTHWSAGQGWVKLPAAWLLEQAGFVKGYGAGPVRISTKHTLALTNRGGGTFADVLALQGEIVDGVERTFGIRLEREPVVLQSDNR